MTSLLLFSESSLLHPIKKELQEKEAQLQVAQESIMELRNGNCTCILSVYYYSLSVIFVYYLLLTSVENEMKTEISSKKDIELEKLHATVKSNQKKLQNLTKKLPLLTEGMSCCCKFNCAL